MRIRQLEVVFDEGDFLPVCVWVIVKDVDDRKVADDELFLLFAVLRRNILSCLSR